MEKPDNKMRSMYDLSRGRFNQPGLSYRFRFSNTNLPYPQGISFLSLGSVVEDSDKRSAHNALERQRREGLNNKYQQLAHALPTLQTVRRPSKTMIVSKSLEYGKNLAFHIYLKVAFMTMYSFFSVCNSDTREATYLEQIRTLRKENERLKRQAKRSNLTLRRRSSAEKTLVPPPLPSTMHQQSPLATEPSHALGLSTMSPSSYPVTVSPLLSSYPSSASDTTINAYPPLDVTTQSYGSTTPIFTNVYQPPSSFADMLMGYAAATILPITTSRGIPSPSRTLAVTSFDPLITSASIDPLSSMLFESNSSTASGFTDNTY
ncbi:uncharacterized protein BYT42DRAFT_557180 [Radiomyces spectabilis]|uniref:uncharacterized protein n=1 Tax=Radiomyces spectabilis TaxID=64574 RepID=UPI00221F4159|nr:uncharacterized protein BYT42DRAFT_557180 [Radiomyces spectabilis]KAI8391524.1 hypothetical protein BYT42DRAFT_557180 [Radiomyces spectabilis]